MLLNCSSTKWTQFQRHIRSCTWSPKKTSRHLLACGSAACRPGLDLAVRPKNMADAPCFARRIPQNLFGYTGRIQPPPLDHPRNGTKRRSWPYKVGAYPFCEVLGGSRLILCSCISQPILPVQSMGGALRHIPGYTLTCWIVVGLFLYAIPPPSAASGICLWEIVNMMESLAMIKK